MDVLPFPHQVASPFAIIRAEPGGRLGAIIVQLEAARSVLRQVCVCEFPRQIRVIDNRELTASHAIS
jgi:hypothetical protein